MNYWNCSSDTNPSPVLLEKLIAQGKNT